MVTTCVIVNAATSSSSLNSSPRACLYFISSGTDHHPHSTCYLHLSVGFYQDHSFTYHSFHRVLSTVSHSHQTRLIHYYHCHPPHLPPLEPACEDWDGDEDWVRPHTSWCGKAWGLQVRGSGRYSLEKASFLPPGSQQFHARSQKKYQNSGNKCDAKH